MLLCAKTPEVADTAEQSLVVVEAPAGAAVGERIVIEVADGAHGDAAQPNKVAKKKMYEKVAPFLCTDDGGNVCFKESPFMTAAGPCTAKSILKGIVS